LAIEVLFLRHWFAHSCRSTWPLIHTVADPYTVTDLHTIVDPHTATDPNVATCWSTYGHWFVYLERSVGFCNCAWPSLN